MSTSIEKEMVQPENEVENIELLSSIEDAHGGVTVEMTKHMDSEQFALMLGSSLSYWKQQKKRGVWIKLPIEFSNLVEPAVKEGFRYHHAESDYLMLVKWILETSDTLPANASHRVGIGAFVINDKGEVLVVQERNGRFKGTNVWKLPTGTVEEGEDICTAAIREVKEETGVDTEFVEVLAFRQSHQSFFRKSDLFFVCMLRPRSFKVQKQDSEIEVAQWMRAEDYAAQPFNQKNDIFKNMAGICLTKLKKDYTGFSTMSSTTSSGKRAYMYFNNRDFEPPSLRKDAHEVNNDDKPMVEVQVDSSAIGKVSSGSEKTSLSSPKIVAFSSSELEVVDVGSSNSNIVKTMDLVDVGALILFLLFFVRYCWFVPFLAAAQPWALWLFCCFVCCLLGLAVCLASFFMRFKYIYI